ncbi:SANT/Myb domain [Dillenia turbinata]|uniref:Transcriptional adapter n=1 Tax=Dillenia turbinata TaxID=194707 RepID=A0AAN8UW44_9MAGN
MGRSRAVYHPADDDITQCKSKRKRAASSVEVLEAGIACQGGSEGKKALYHCNYCNKDISGKIRIKCYVCPDFDLCVECFYVGVEITPHKRNHPYRVMDNLSFPLFCPDWNTDEEILLLEGIEMYGLGNWAEVAEHVGTKSKSQCVDHYSAVYMNSPCFPRPDMSHVAGKNREELLAVAKTYDDAKKGVPMLGEDSSKEEPVATSKVKIEESRASPFGHSSSLPAGTAAIDASCPFGPSNGNKSTSTTKRASKVVKPKDSLERIKVEDFQSDRSIGEKKPKFSEDEGPSMTELSGYNSKRQEFELEYDNDAEQLLADMEFKETDTEAEREVKLRVLRIYSKRLDERKRRKDFILDRQLLFPDPFEKNLSPEEREICKRYRVFMRYNSKEEHYQLLKIIVEQQRIIKRIQDLQEARAAGCRATAEANRYIEQRKKEAEETARKVKESALAGTGGKVLLKTNLPKGENIASPQGGVKGPTDQEFGGRDLCSSTVQQSFLSNLDEWDISGFPGAELLSENEKQLCKETKMLPPQYLKMQEIMSREILNGHITKKPDAHNLFKVDACKIDRVYDMLVKKGMAQP